MPLLSAERSALLIVDIQDRLTPVMTDPRRVIHHAVILMRAARELALPLLVSEQYPQGLGPSVFDLREWIPDGGLYSKLHFSCAVDPAILAALRQTGRTQIVVAGVEAHVCVLQSCLGLQAAGFEVFVVADACASRRVESETLAFARMAAAGISVVSTEMVVFEWLQQAGTPAFKRLSPLIR